MRSSPSAVLALLATAACGFSALEQQLIGHCTAGRDAAISDCITALQADGGIANPALSPLIEGEWELLHSTKTEFDAKNPLGRRVDGSRPGLEALFPGSDQPAQASSSPIQRAIVNAFRVTQSLTDLQQPSRGRVEQLVSTPLGELHLNAAARVDAANGQRVSFAFDEGYFQSTVGVRLPYPVPFRLLGKEAEGYLDTTYLSETLRISTGNKGTTFVLRRVGSSSAS